MEDSSNLMQVPDSDKFFGAGDARYVPRMFRKISAIEKNTVSDNRICNNFFIKCLFRYW